MKILVVEDNKLLADRIKQQLHQAYVVDVVHTGAEVLQKLKDITYSVIILDLGLPDRSGASICQAIRQLHIQTPILIVTGVDTVTSRVTLLNLGADDYITKPFFSSEFQARVAALARRQPLYQQPRTITHGDVVIDTQQRKVTRGGKEIELRRKEFDILEYLLHNPGRVLTRDMIINQVWDSRRTNWNTTVDVHIKHLRDKIDRPYDAHLIKTVYGLGYGVDLPD